MPPRKKSHPKTQKSLYSNNYGVDIAGSQEKSSMMTQDDVTHDEENVGDDAALQHHGEDGSALQHDGEGDDVTMWTMCDDGDDVTMVTMVTMWTMVTM